MRWTELASWSRTHGLGENVSRGQAWNTRYLLPDWLVLIAFQETGDFGVLRDRAGV